MIYIYTLNFEKDIFSILQTLFLFILYENGVGSYLVDDLLFFAIQGMREC